MWNDRHGQIIGLKRKEHQAAESRGTLKRRITLVARTLSARRHDGDRRDDLASWAAEQLERALAGQDVTPFSLTSDIEPY